MEQRLGPKTLRVDRALNTVYQVKIIGFDSDNGRRYTPEALKAACKLYEGIKVNVDHPDNPDDSRSVYDRIGKLTNIKFIEGKGIFGDLWLLPSHQLTPEVYDAAELMPDMFGLSHNAQGEGEDDKEGIFVVYKITEVRHVDLVADPATTNSLLESRSVKPLRRKTMKEEEKEPLEAEYEEKDTKEEGDQKQQVMDILNGDGSDEEKAEAICNIWMDDEEDTTEAEDAKEDNEKDTKESDSEVTEAMDDEMEDDEEEKEDTKESKQFKKSKKGLQEQLNSLKKNLYIHRLFEANKLPLEKKLIEELKGASYRLIKNVVNKLALAHKVTKARNSSPVMEERTVKIGKGSDVYQWIQN
jgi:hypothetical protein